jgi:hypothetical protein
VSVARLARTIRLLATLVLVIGILLSPLRAAAATIPMLIAYDAAVFSTATVRVEARPSLQPERGGVPEYVYDDAHEGYDDASNPHVVGGAGADDTYDNPDPTAAAEGLGGASTLAGDSYEILDGVRRAKAATELGQETISAVVQVGGKTVATGEVPVSSLLSPTKSVIDVSTPSAMQRWLSVLKGTQAGDALPPIVIQPGARGVPIPGVGFQF